LVLLKQQNFRY